MTDMMAQLAQAYEAGLAAEKAGDATTAQEHYRRCLDLDPDDRCGASMRLASLGLAPPPAKAPDAYVTTLFDQHADRFDDILTGDLAYAVPMQLAEWISANAPGPYARMVDLGCGTGLAGMTLLPFCDHATGVELSEDMLDLADERAVYDALFVNEAVHFLQEHAASDDPDHLPFDLIVATDMLPYVGALEPLFDGIAANAAPKATLGFSAETVPEDQFGDTGWSITPHQRFAHRRSYLEAMCARAGFSDIACMEPITVRLEQGCPIAGWLVVARR